jgi:hypothetical protein
MIVLYRYGLDNLDVALSGFKILAHTELTFFKDPEFVPQFQNFMLTLKRIDSLGKELKLSMETKAVTVLESKDTPNPEKPEQLAARH